MMSNSFCSADPFSLSRSNFCYLNLGHGLKQSSRERKDFWIIFTGFVKETLKSAQTAAGIASVFCLLRIDNSKLFSCRKPVICLEKAILPPQGDAASPQGRYSACQSWSFCSIRSRSSRSGCVSRKARLRISTA